jgi:uncharacterized protein YydD (DUF2326 family)
MKQAQLMQDILTLKIESENRVIQHFQEINAFRNEINSYTTIISKLELDLAHRES